MERPKHTDQLYRQGSKSYSKTSVIKAGSTISVVAPAFNCERFIGKTLDIVYAQTRRPDQVIVVDDGSTDGTADAVEGYFFSESRLETYALLLKKFSQ